MITQAQFEIIDHTIKRAANGMFCGGGEDMTQLVKAGLMKFECSVAFVPDPYYSVTEKGKELHRRVDRDRHSKPLIKAIQQWHQEQTKTKRNNEPKG